MLYICTFAHSRCECVDLTVLFLLKKSPFMTAVPQLMPVQNNPDKTVQHPEPHAVQSDKTMCQSRKTWTVG